MSIIRPLSSLCLRQEASSICRISARLYSTRSWTREMRNQMCDLRADLGDKIADRCTWLLEEMCKKGGCPLEQSTRRYDSWTGRVCISKDAPAAYEKALNESIRKEVEELARKHKERLGD